MQENILRYFLSQLGIPDQGSTRVWHNDTQNHTVVQRVMRMSCGPFPWGRQGHPSALRDLLLLPEPSSLSRNHNTGFQLNTHSQNPKLTVNGKRWNLGMSLRTSPHS